MIISVRIGVEVELGDLKVKIIYEIEIWSPIKNNFQ